MWDVFISHASEDKPFVRELARALKERGVEVWFDEMTLKLGDSLQAAIAQGLAESRYGVVVLSPAFFGKRWTKHELDGLVAKEVQFGKTILPVWHQVTARDVMRYSPALAGKMAVSTDQGLEAVVEAIMDVLRPTEKAAWSSPAQSYSPVRKGEKLDLVDLPQLRESLTRYFSVGELRTLCFDLGVDFDDLPGQGKSSKARELIAYLDRRGRLHELVELARKLRPQVAW